MGDRRLSGRRLCGAVAFSAEPGKELHPCHCGQRRRFSGGVFMVVDCGSTLDVERGGEALAFFGSSSWGERGFCNTCGASLFWRGKVDGGTFASIQAFDDPGDSVFATELYIDRKPANYAFNNHTRQVTEAEFLATLAGNQV